MWLDGMLGVVVRVRCFTDLAVLVCELERVNQTQRLVYAATDREIIDGNLLTSSAIPCPVPQHDPTSRRVQTHLPHYAIRIDQKQPAQRNPLVLKQNPIILAQTVVLITEQRDVDLAQTSVPFTRIRPCQKTVLGIRACENDGGATGGEIGHAVAEGDDLGRTYEGPGHGYETEDEPLLGRGVGGEADFCSEG